MPPVQAFGDFIHPFRIEGPGVHGRLVRLGAVLDGILVPHAYPPAVAAVMGETLALAAVMGGGLKIEGRLTVQMQSDGPVNLVVADVASDGAMRGYARFDGDRVDGATPVSHAPVPHLLGAGHLAFTVDQGADTDLYQGITALSGSTLADTARDHFRRSEQLDTAISLAAEAGDGRAGARAAGLMIQRPPAGEVDEEAWRRAEILTDSVTAVELLDPSLAPDDVLFRLYHGDGVRVYRPRPLRFACRCSRDRVERTIRSFPQSEIDTMMVDGRIVVTCEFCKTDYAFDGAALDALFTS